MNRQRSSGFSLMEALVTLLLIGIGVLGMSTLQVRAIQYTHDAAQRNAAAVLANDLVELMRAMPTGLPSNSGFYKAAEADFPDAPESCTPLPTDPNEQLACWAERAKVALPGASDLLTNEFYICRADESKNKDCSDAGSVIEIQLAWRVKLGECMDATAAANSDLSICRYRLRTRITE